jgi:hypothetical protein
MALHRIQIDVDIEASSHQEAVEKVQDWMVGNRYHPDMKDHLVLEEHEEVCHTCNPVIMKPTYWNNIESKKEFDVEGFLKDSEPPPPKVE